MHALTEEFVLVVECYDSLTSDFSEKSSLPVQIWVYKQKFSSVNSATFTLKQLFNIFVFSCVLSQVVYQICWALQILFLYEMYTFISE